MLHIHAVFFTVAKKTWMNREPDRSALRARIKALLVETLMLQVSEAEITDEQPLFGPGGLGLDSVDALQLVVALDKHYGLKITDAAAAKGILQSVASMAEAVAMHQKSAGDRDIGPTVAAPAPTRS